VKDDVLVVDVKDMPCDDANVLISTIIHAYSSVEDKLDKKYMLNK
jgi:hypothetical protein